MGPAAAGGAVQARDHRQVERGLGVGDESEVAVELVLAPGLGEVGERLGEGLGSLREESLPVEGRVGDVLLEERRQDDRRGARVLESLERVDTAGQRARRGDEGARELQPEVGGAQIGHRRRPIGQGAPSVGSGSGKVRSIPASWV